MSGGVSSSARWLVGCAVVRAIIQFLQIAILARFLMPEDFGRMALAVGFSSLLSMISDVGISSSLIHFQKSSKDDFSGVFLVNVGFSVIAAIIFIIIAYPASIIFQDFLIFKLCCLISLTFPLNAIGSPIKAISEKELSFGNVTIFEVLAVFVGFGVAVIASINELGVYSLVAGLISISATNSILLLGATDYRKHLALRLRFPQVRKYIDFGISRAGESFVGALRMQADTFIGSYLFGSSMMGYYVLPRDLSLKIANTIINPTITRISYPLLSVYQSNREELRRVYLKTINIVASLNFPVYVFVVIFSEEIVYLLYGDKWISAGFYLSLFGVWGLVRSVGNPVGSLLYAAGEMKRAFLWNVALLIVMPILILIGAVWVGLQGMAFALILGQSISLLLAWKFLVAPVCDATLNEYFGQLVSPGVSVVVAGFLTWLAVNAFLNETFFYYRIFWGALTFGLIYLIMSYWINRSFLLTILNLALPLSKS